MTWRQARCLSYVRRMGRLAYGGYIWLLFALAMLFLLLVMLLRRPSWGRPITRFTARLLFRLACIPLSVDGLERLPAEPHVLLVNHTSFLDPIALTALLPTRPGYAFTARQQFPIQRVLCPLLRGVGAVILRSGSQLGHHRSNVRRISSALRCGQRLIIFPEGGFIPEVGLRPFHSGAFAAAANARVPIVIAGLRGAREGLRPGTWAPRRSAVHLEIGPTFMPAGKNEAHLLQLRMLAHQAMLPLTGEPDAS